MKRCFILLIGLLAARLAHGEDVTTGTMLRELVDLERLCDMPEHHYKTMQFTSYDRRSNMPGGPDWFSNADGFGNSPIIPFEQELKQPGDDGVGEYLLAEVEGPGVIVRTWTAAINGRIRVYLDGSKKPVYDGPATDFMHRPYDTFVKEAGVEADLLNGALYQRDAGYCPMPFAKRCRIEWIGNPRQVYFYYVQIRKYTDAVAVQTFEPADLSTYKNVLVDVCRTLKSTDEVPTSGETHDINLSIEPGQRSETIELQGPGAIEQLKLLVSAADQVAALRQTVMRISFDGWSNPQVQSPVGDFFAAAPGVNPYQSLPFSVDDDGTMVCRYQMPYQTSVRIHFENLGDQTVEVKGSLTTKQRAWNDERTMHFYARWRVLHDLPTNPSEEIPALDIPFLLAQGEGRFVGAVSLMMNPARGTHPDGSWWGEGDEKVWIDDDQTPSWFGTGSEDYYNYSWSAVDLFDYPYCGQPRNDGPGNRGFVTNYRFHMIDDQPFQQRISFFIELLAHYHTTGFSYACQAYHYGRPGIIDDHRYITREDVRRPELKGPFQPLAYRGSEGATYIEAETVAEGEVTTEKNDFWSQGEIMVWKPERKGDILRLKLPVAKSGPYEVRLCMGIDHRGGSVSATLDGKSFGFGFEGEQQDLYDPRRTMMRASTSDRVELAEGDHVVELTYEGGRNEPEPFVGVDFIWLQPK